MQEVENSYLDNVGDDWEPGDSRTQKKIVAAMEYAYQVMGHFPKTERFAMVADIKRALDLLLELVIECDRGYYKKTGLQKADTQNKKLKHYVRIAYRLHYIGPKQYKIWSGYHAEIGKMLGKRIQSAR